MGSKEVTAEASQPMQDCTSCNDDKEKEKENECSKVSLVRALVEKQDPSAKEEDDRMIRRFLRAGDLDIDKASDLFLKYLKWRRSFVPNGSFSESEIGHHLSHNKQFMQGLDNQGRPIVTILLARHFPSKDGTEELKRYVVYSLDRICSRIPQGQEKFLVIVDLKGWGYSNCDIRGYVAAFSILQDSYPERLGKLFLINVPYLFMKVWKIIYPFIDKKTREKAYTPKQSATKFFLSVTNYKQAELTSIILSYAVVVFVESKMLVSTLAEDIDESQLPDIYGGKLPLVAIQDS